MIDGPIPEGLTFDDVLLLPGKSSILPTEVDTPWKKVLGGLKSGGHAPATLPHPFNCRVDLHGTFSDGQSMDASDVDVCAQKTLNLTD